MKLALGLIFLLFFLTQIKISKLRAFLFFCLAISCFSNLLISSDVPFNSFFDIFIVFLITFFFCTVIFCLFPNVKIIPDITSLKKGRASLSFLVIALCAPMVLVNIYILYKSYLFILSGDISMTEFKNDGHSSILISSIFPPYVSPFIRLFSLLGWFSLLLTMISIINKRYKTSLLAFIGSFNIPFMGLIAFSRSGIVYYLFSVLVLWIVFEKDIERRFATKVKRVFLVFFSVILVLFSYITYDRFSDYEYWWVYAESGSNINVVVFSVIYYFTSWIDNTIVLLRELQPPLIGHFNGYFSLFYYFLSAFGFSVDSKADVWQSYFGDYSTLFVGLFLDTLFDAGVFGFLYLIVLLYILRAIQSRLKIKQSTFMLQVLFSSQYFALFFAGNIVSYFFFTIALLISFLLLKLSSSRYFRL